jgi:hypothetical protein
MKDNKNYGLPQSLIDTVVEAIKGGQKKLDVAEPKGKLTSADFKALRSGKKPVEEAAKCNMTEAGKICEVHGMKACPGVKEEVSVEEASELPKEVITKAHKIAKAIIRKKVGVREPYAVGMAAAKKEKMIEQVEEIQESESKNKSYGYYGSAASHSDNPGKHYRLMHSHVKQVASASGHLSDAKKPNVMVRDYLDSKHGRHLHDVYGTTPKTSVERSKHNDYIARDFGRFKKSYKEEDYK